MDELLDLRMAQRIQISLGLTFCFGKMGDKITLEYVVRLCDSLAASEYPSDLNGDGKRQRKARRVLSLAKSKPPILPEKLIFYNWRV